MATYKKTKDVDDKIEEVFAYGVFQFGISQASHYVEMLYDQFDTIARNPILYKESSHVVGCRVCNVLNDDIYYIVDNSEVVIQFILGRDEPRPKFI